MHHDFSDTQEDPHSPHFFRDIFGMMWHTKKIYSEICDHTEKYEKWDTKRPIWSWFEKMGESWASRLGWGALYLLFYVYFVPVGHEWLYTFVPIHWLMNPFHGALVNWCGHKYGYRNIETDDKSVNCMPWDIMLLGEWFQNNHHEDGNNPNLANKKWEIDPLYYFIKLGSVIGLYKMA
jgi:stearoyl-CoA desaturase (delta-9 desaturase)